MAAGVIELRYSVLALKQWTYGFILPGCHLLAQSQYIFLNINFDEIKFYPFF